MSRQDHYSTLGVARTATELQIRKAYRLLVLKYHPDRNPGNKEAEDQFKRLAEAYGTLSNRESRSRYDLSLVEVDPEVVFEAQREATRKKAEARAREAAARPRETPAESRSRRERETFADYRMESNELEQRDLIHGIIAGAIASTVLHYVQTPEDQRVAVYVLGLWCIAPLVAGPAGFTFGTKLGKLFEGLIEKLAGVFPALEHLGKLLPFAGTLVGACGGLLASRAFDVELFTWKIVPGTIAAGCASAIGSAFGRAFTSVAERMPGKALGVVVGLAVGCLAGLLLGIFLAVFATGPTSDFALFEGFFAAGFGGALGGALASGAGSLRQPSVVEAPYEVSFRGRRAR